MLISNLEKQEITNLIFNKKFEEAQNQVNQLIKKANKHYNAQIVFIIAHKFLQNRLEGNGKTHNYNYKNYKNEILKISKSYKTKIIDIHKKLKSYPA